MTQNQILLTICIFSIVVLSGIMIWAKKTAKDKSVTINYNKRRNPFSYAIYRILSTNRLTKKYYGKVKRKYGMLYPSDDPSITRQVTKMFTSAATICVCAMIVFVIIGKSDVFYTCLGIWMTGIIFTFYIDSSFNRLETKLLNQFSDYLTELRHYYHETNMLDSSLYMTLDNLPTEMSLHAQKIYEMVEDTDTTDKVDRYARNAPNRFFMTFAAICASIKEYGDKRVDDVPLFLTNINYLKEELNIELLKKKKNDYLFSGLAFISLAPVLLLKPLELWMTSNMPETSSYFQGAGGTISTIIVFVISFLAYQVIGSLKDGRVDEMQEHALMHWLARMPFISRILVMIENHKYSKTLKIGDDLKITGDKIGTRAFLLKRFLIGLACMILFNIASFIVIEKQKTDLFTNFTEAFENSVVPNEDYRIIMEETAKEYTASYEYITGKDANEQKEELAKKITSERQIKPKYAEEIADVILSHSKSAANTYYKWWILLLSFGAGVIGYYIPLWLLKYRVSVMKMNMEDEVVQFQTLILILMYEDGVTLNVILDWMERFSFCFKDSIRKCIVNLEQNQQDALIELRDSEPFPPFKRYVDNLLAIDNAGIAGAFDEIKTEREYYKNKRAEDNEIICNKKASVGRTIAFVPYFIMLAGHLIIPFLALAMNMFSMMSDILA